MAGPHLEGLHWGTATFIFTGARKRQATEAILVHQKHQFSHFVAKEDFAELYEYFLYLPFWHFKHHLYIRSSWIIYSTLHTFPNCHLTINGKVYILMFSKIALKWRYVFWEIMLCSLVSIKQYDSMKKIENSSTKIPYTWYESTR